MSSPSRARGFTLIEILVGLVIIGIVMSVAVLSLNLAGDDREVRREARRLMSLIEVAQHDAMMQGRDFGLEFMKSGYRFVEYDPASGQWAEPLFDDSLRLWQIDEHMEFDLFIEEKRVLLDEQPREIEDAESRRPGTEVYAPHLLIFSSGDSTPFELHVASIDADQRLGIRGDLLGNLELIPDDEIEF